jgi:hypothetical protein
VKLVETDAALATEDVPDVARPPRPEHRKTYVSLAVTGAVLVATVAVVYLLFPKRDHQVIDEAIAQHRAPAAFELERPTPPELTAWTIGILARPVKWPTGAGLEVVGVRRVELFKRPAALVRYRVDDVEVSLAAMTPWDAPRRAIQVDEEDVHAIWWRSGGWTMIAVGPKGGAWAKRLGAP